MSMIRKIMRNIMRNGAKRKTLSGAPAVGSRRAGMHQAAEHEYRRSRMADTAGDGAPIEETPEEALDFPAEVEAEIPPVEEEDDEEVEAIAEGEAAVEAETEILDEIADPEASIEEEEADTVVQMSVDYSGERIPELTPPAPSGVGPDTPLMYSSGDGSLKEIQEPLPGIGEKLGIPPLFNGVPDPSANVAAYDEPEPEPDPEPDPTPDPDTPDTPGE